MEVPETCRALAPREEERAEQDRKFYLLSPVGKLDHLKEFHPVWLLEFIRGWFLSGKAISVNYLPINWEACN